VLKYGLINDFDKGSCRKLNFCRAPNSYCMLVSTPKIIFWNTGIPKWGAFAGTRDIFWSVAVNDGGSCRVAFNGQDDSGVITQVIEIIRVKDFAEMYSNVGR